MTIQSKTFSASNKITAFLIYSVIIFFAASPTKASVLPDQRVDIMAHSFSGGGVTVTGPSILVRKSVGSALSVSANYYVDMISSASIDVLATASKYSEERKQKSINLDYMHDRTNYSLGYVTSDENDYHSKTYSFGVTQSFFGDLTTLGLGLVYGQDRVGQTIGAANNVHHRLPDPDQSHWFDKQHRSYSFNISQIITKNLISDFVIESSTDACIKIDIDKSCLNNPYRVIRFKDSSTAGFGTESEFYPHTHNMDAIGFSSIYHLPFAATIRLDTRSFTDSWGIKAHNAELRYVQEMYKNYIVEIKYRAYAQTHADFYNDLFPFRDPQNFYARDRELSSFTSKSIGAGVTYKFPWHIPGFDKSTANLYWDHMQVDYSDFRDYNHFMDGKKSKAVFKLGEEPLYKLNADVIRFYLSFWF